MIDLNIKFAVIFGTTEIFVSPFQSKISKREYDRITLYLLLKDHITLRLEYAIKNGNVGKLS